MCTLPSYVCVQFIHFVIFFSDLSRTQIRNGMRLKTVFAVPSVVVFIAFCTVLGLYIKGNAHLI